jgi:hypothetical protein
MEVAPQTELHLRVDAPSGDRRGGLKKKNVYTHNDRHPWVFILFLPYYIFLWIIISSEYLMITGGQTQ